MVGLDNLRGLFQPMIPGLYDSMNHWNRFPSKFVGLPSLDAHGPGQPARVEQFLSLGLDWMISRDALHPPSIL